MNQTITKENNLNKKQILWIKKVIKIQMIINMVLIELCISIIDGIMFLVGNKLKTKKRVEVNLKIVLGGSRCSELFFWGIIF